MLHSNVDVIPSWLHKLDDEAGVSPSWEIFFQAMCCPVPQELKASLDEAIAAVARRPDLAAALWERLLSAVVVLPYSGTTFPDSGGSLARYDLAYQLNEIEARAEDYTEALAFVRLVNQLWRVGGTSLADDGRPVAHITRFIREEILATAFQRPFRSETQRWELIAAALEHCRLCLDALPASPAAFAQESALAAVPRPPGLDILLDLLGEQSVGRAAMLAVSMGVDQLAQERHAASAGAAKEAAALAALRLLSTGFRYDAEFVAAAKLSLHRTAYSGLDAVLRHDRARIPLLLEYVRYPFNAQVQEEALRVARVIAQRTPNLVSLLLTMPAPGAPLHIVGQLQDSFASCLHDATASMGAGAHPFFGDDGNVADQRASLVLDLLTSDIESPAPNFTQLLCGFDVESGTTPQALHDPRALHTPLRVALGILGQHEMAVTRPRIYEQCLELVYRLAADADTGEVYN